MATVTALSISVSTPKSVANLDRYGNRNSDYLNHPEPESVANLDRYGNRNWSESHNLSEVSVANKAKRSHVGTGFTAQEDSQWGHRDCESILAPKAGSHF